MELADIPGTSLKVSRIAIGTWAIGSWMWGELMKLNRLPPSAPHWTMALMSSIRRQSMVLAIPKRSSAKPSLKAACALVCYRDEGRT